MEVVATATTCVVSPAPPEAHFRCLNTFYIMSSLIKLQKPISNSISFHRTNDMHTISPFLFSREIPHLTPPKYAQMPNLTWLEGYTFGFFGEPHDMTRWEDGGVGLKEG